MERVITPTNKDNVMKLFNRKPKGNAKNTGKKGNTIDKAMNNLKRNGVREEDTLSYVINKGKTTQKTPLSDREIELLNESEISRGSRATQREITRIYIKYLANTSVTGLDTIRLGEILVNCYNHNAPDYKMVMAIQKEFEVDNEIAKSIVKTIMIGASTLSDWEINKDRGAVSFSIECPNNNRYDGKEFPMGDIKKYLEFIIDNNGVVYFHSNKKKADNLRKQIRIGKK